MKYCIKCTEFKDESEFKWRNRAKGWLKPYCIPCNRAYDKEHHSSRSSESKVKKSIWESKWRDNITEKIALYQIEHPCVDCGQKDIRALQFDHILDNKIADISNMVGQKIPWEKISEEIFKCEVRCGSCHQIMTHKRANTRKQKLFLKYQSHLLTNPEILVQLVNGINNSKSKLKEDPKFMGTCPDCTVEPNNIHDNNCDVQRCSECRGKRLDMIVKIIIQHMYLGPILAPAKLNFSL